MKRQKSLNRAKKIYEKFTGHNPDFIEEVKITIPETATAVGELVGVIYRATRDGETADYMHEFEKSNPPILAVTENGRQLLILGGQYYFTDQGIID